MVDGLIGRRAQGQTEVLVNTDTKSAEEVSAEVSRTISEEPSPAKESAASSKRKGIAAKPRRGSKTGKAARQPRPSARATSKDEKLVCRYCGSDDLAPSFKKRRDARCRACFKKRYSSPAQRKNNQEEDQAHTGG